MGENIHIKEKNKTQTVEKQERKQQESRNLGRQKTEPIGKITEEIIIQTTGDMSSHLPSCSRGKSVAFSFAISEGVLLGKKTYATVNETCATYLC